MLNLQPIKDTIDYFEGYEETAGLQEGYIHYAFSLDLEKTIAKR